MIPTLLDLGDLIASNVGKTFILKEAIHQCIQVWFLLWIITDFCFVLFCFFLNNFL